MKSANALFQFFNNGPELNSDLQYVSISVRELKDFKETMSKEEYHDLAKQACDIMGEVWEA